MISLCPLQICPLTLSPANPLTKSPANLDFISRSDLYKSSSYFSSLEINVFFKTGSVIGRLNTKVFFLIQFCKAFPPFLRRIQHSHILKHLWDKKGVKGFIKFLDETLRFIKLDIEWIKDCLSQNYQVWITNYKLADGCNTPSKSVS